MLAAKGSLFVTRPTLMTYTAKREDLEATAADLFDVIKSGKVKIEINQTYAAARTLHRRIAISRAARPPARLFYCPEA